MYMDLVSEPYETRSLDVWVILTQNHVSFIVWIVQVFGIMQGCCVNMEMCNLLRW
jgi:hypothetical protein